MKLEIITSAVLEQLTIMCTECGNRGVDRLFPRCLETPPCAQKGWGQAHREVVQRYIASPDRFPGSSAYAILEKRSSTR